MTTFIFEVGDRLFYILCVGLTMILGIFFTRTVLFLIGEAKIPDSWRRKKRRDYAV